MTSIAIVLEMPRDLHRLVACISAVLERATPASVNSAAGRQERGQNLRSVTAITAVAPKDPAPGLPPVGAGSPLASVRYAVWNVDSDTYLRDEACRSWTSCRQDARRFGSLEEAERHVLPQYEGRREVVIHSLVRL